MMVCISFPRLITWVLFGAKGAEHSYPYSMAVKLAIDHAALQSWNPLLNMCKASVVPSKLAEIAVIAQCDLIIGMASIIAVCTFLIAAIVLVIWVVMAKPCDLSLWIKNFLLMQLLLCSVAFISFWYDSSTVHASFDVCLLPTLPCIVSESEGAMRQLASTIWLATLTTILGWIPLVSLVAAWLSRVQQPNHRSSSG